MSFPTIKFGKWRCRVLRERYAFPPHPTALLLEAACLHAAPPGEDPVREGERIAVATVFVEGAILAPDEVLIKSWEENHGMAATLQNAGIIGPELRRVSTGWVEATVHKLLVK